MICDVLAEIYRSGAKSVHLDLGIPLYLYVTGKLHFMLLVGQTDLKAKKTDFRYSGTNQP